MTAHWSSLTWVNHEPHKPTWIWSSGRTNSRPDTVSLRWLATSSTSTTVRTSRTLRALSLRPNDARDAAVVFMGKKLKDLDGEFLARGPMVHPPADETDATVCTIRVTGDQPAV